MEAARRLPALVMAAMVALVALATANLSGFGIGGGALLYDTIALPRLVPAVVLTLAAWAAWAWGAARTGASLRVDITWALLAALGALAIVSAAVTEHRALAVLGQSERLHGVVTMLLFALVYGAGLQVARRVSDVRAVVRLAGVAVVPLGLYGIAQFAGLDAANYFHEGYGFELNRAFATFGNPNFLAGFLILVLPPVAALALEEDRAWRRLAWGGVALLAGAAIFLTFTRGAWFVALGQAAVAGVLYLRRRRRAEKALTADSGGRRARTRLVAVIVVVVVALALIGASLATTGHTNVAERLASLFQADGSIPARVLLVGVAADVVTQRPLTGWGPDAFLSAFRQFRPDGFVDAFGEPATMNSAHSWPLQYVVTLGLPAALVLLAALGWALWRGRPQGAAPGEAEGRPRLLMTGVWLGCLGAAVYLLFNVAFIGVTVPLMALLGLLGAPHARSVRPGTGALRAVAAGAAVLALLAAASSVALVAADRAYLLSRQAYYAEIADDPVQLARSAVGLNPTSIKYARGHAQALGQLVERAIDGGDPAEKVRERYALAADAYARALALDEDDYAALAWFAALQVRAGSYLGDDDLKESGVWYAARAAELDRHAAFVEALAAGDMSPAAVSRAELVLPLP